MSDSSIDMIVCPLFETGPRNLRNSEGSVVELRDGRLLLYYMNFYTGATDWSAADVRGKISDDGGQTWSEPFLVEPNTARFNVGRLSLFRLPPHVPVGEDEELGHVHHGLLAHVYVEMNDGLNRRMIFKTSADEGETWSPPVPLNPQNVSAGVSQDKAIVLGDGRIVVPVDQYMGTKPTTDDPKGVHRMGERFGNLERSALVYSFTLYSDDEGQTWSPMRQLNFRGDSPSMIRLSSGALLAAAREAVALARQPTFGQ